MNFLVIDGNSILNRAFYGIKVLTTKDGRFTNAIYGFMNIFLRLKDECQPQAVAVAFDVKQPTFRHEMYGGYKATRKGMPDELAQQMPVLKELLEAMGVPIVEKPGYEADDILGTLARHSGDAVCTIAPRGGRCLHDSHWRQRQPAIGLRQRQCSARRDEDGQTRDRQIHARGSARKIRR